MRHLSIMACGALAALMAPATDAGRSRPKLLVNDSDLPRFTAAGVLVEPGKTFPADELHTKDFIAKSTPVGNLTDEQLRELMVQRGLTPNPQAPASEPGAAPVAPMTSPAAIDDLDERQAEQRDEIEDDDDVQRASEVIDDESLTDKQKEEAAEKAREARLAELKGQRGQTNPPDLDGDSKPGGSRTKAEIAAELTDLGVEFDPKAKRDELAAILDAKLKQSPQA